MKLLKTVAFGASFFLSLTSAASALSPCPSDPSVVWTICQGTYTFDYEGDTGERPKGKGYNSQGVRTFSEGAVYVGEWKDNKAHGQGTTTFPNGAKYVGEMKEDLAHGLGTATDVDGAKYVGEMKDDKRNGQGTATYPDGAKYVGEWKDGKPNGQGALTYSDGAKYVGEMTDSKRNGQGYKVLRNGGAGFCEFTNNNDGSKCVGSNIHDVAPALKSYFSSLPDSQRKGIQRKLGGIGYYNSTIDGLWGSDIFTALVTYAALHLDTIAVRNNEIASNVINALLQDAAPQSPSANETYKVASGTGFYVSGDGHIITNNHVIDGCKEIKIHSKGKIFDTVVVASDSQNDLALLKSDEAPAIFFSLSQDNPYPLQDVIVAGFPFGDRVSSSLKFTRGIVSSVTGIGNNYSEIQIDAALQPGNSGGPILDEFGNVIAVAVAKLDMKKILDDYGVIPEDTNFGVKSSAVRNLMEGNRIAPESARQRTLSRLELSKLATDATVFLSCWMTTAQIEQLKTRKVLFAEFE